MHLRLSETQLPPVVLSKKFYKCLILFKRKSKKRLHEKPKNKFNKKTMMILMGILVQPLKTTVMKMRLLSSTTTNGVEVTVNIETVPKVKK
jgi:hypothetical protein